MLHMLQTGQWSQRELAEATGLQRSTVIQWLKMMRHKEHRSVHIAGWEGRTPLFKMGDKKDATRPKKTGAERAQEMRDRKLMAKLHFFQPTERPQ
jgi:transcriptional regulator with XRE-family HTH domain